jgi:hypothetical protein
MEAKALALNLLSFVLQLEMTFYSDLDSSLFEVCESADADTGRSRAYPRVIRFYLDRKARVPSISRAKVRFYPSHASCSKTCFRKMYKRIRKSEVELWASLIEDLLVIQSLDRLILNIQDRRRN